MDQGDRARARQLSDVVDRMLDRKVGRLGGAAGRAVSTTHAFAVFGLIVTLSYSAFFMTFDFTGFSSLVALNSGFAIGYVAIVLLARLGRQLTAALVLLSMVIGQLLIATAWVGWEAGLHLYLLLAGQLVFLILTERQRALRWVFAALALAAFLYAQLRMPSSGAEVELPELVLNAMLSVNAVLVAGTLFVLAAYSHFRAEQARSEAAESAARAEYLANTDALTGLATRRPVMERLEVLSGSAHEPFCLAIADLDRFKLINDEFGHDCGDAVLAAVGARLRGALRVSDSVGRWGGEEFIFVLPGASMSDARIMMERVRSRVGSSPVVHDGREHYVTVSIGLTEGDASGTPHHAILRADEALYRAKDAGRDRVVSLERAATGTHGTTSAAAPASRSAR
ncbi:diguanylate cyclase [Demequina sp. NBRC 110053]|uniref:GGDEF domain-containing protein n=1 Tax=Demequina sp. NBRC 110053 TaxID=1570342 RepID=UPI0013564463|nr:GGDEF domain-containing protein [Demequina sp. NBRC 110053]